EQDAPGRAGGIAGVLVPEEQPHVAPLVGPVLLAFDGGVRRNRLVHAKSPGVCRWMFMLLVRHSRRKTLHCAASTARAPSSAIAKRSSGWVCTRSTWPPGSVA